jgi:hypothetical protein
VSSLIVNTAVEGAASRAFAGLFRERFTVSADSPMVLSSRSGTLNVAVVVFGANVRVPLVVV